MQKVAEAENAFSQDVERIAAAVDKAFAAFQADGERIVEGMEEAEDITGPARARIEAAQEDHKKLQAMIEDIKKAVLSLQGALQHHNAMRGKLIKVLEGLQRELHSPEEGEPSWMRPGTLEALRQGGRDYGNACSRK